VHRCLNYNDVVSELDLVEMATENIEAPANLILPIKHSRFINDTVLPPGEVRRLYSLRIEYLKVPIIRADYLSIVNDSGYNGRGSCGDNKLGHTVLGG
jgi:hypothetical protein